jgi:hypothetical protein
MNLIKFLIILVIFISLNGYLYIRGWQALPDRVLVHMIYTVIFLVASLSIFIGVFLGEKLPLWLSFVFEQVGGYWMILFVFLLSAVLLGDVLRLFNHIFNFYPSWVSLHYPQVKLLYFGLIVLLLGIMSVIGFQRFSHPQVVELDISAGSPSAENSEIIILAASDMHLGNVIRRGRLAEWVDLINSHNPDVVLLAGDIFDHSLRAVESQKMGGELARLRATYGVFAVPGNHDYYAGIDKALDYLQRSGITILRDEVVVVGERIRVIGRDDQTNRNRKTLASLIDPLNSHLPAIVLDHQPHSLNESVENHIALHISGHTHNGQIFPFNRIVSRIYELGYGYRKTGGTHFYVSSGLGLWGAPIRIGTQSEIVKIRFIP